MKLNQPTPGYVHLLLNLAKMQQHQSNITSGPFYVAAGNAAGLVQITQTTQATQPPKIYGITTQSRLALQSVLV